MSWFIESHISQASPPQTSGVSLSPPFVLCLSVSSTGAIAVGTADGCLWIGKGGDKEVSVKKTRKWGGLREDMSLSKKIADGPIVALCVDHPHHLTYFLCIDVLYA
jgi:hypothetical protein